MAFDPDESAVNGKTDEKGRESANVPLYSGAPITVAVSMLLIISFAIRHSLTGLALVDLLTSWFMFIPGFDIIKGISVDYMHCVLLGVTEMLMTLWFDKTHVAEEWNVSKRLDEVERRLLNITPPNCISRTPRSIVKDFSHWRASEFRSFFFFCGIPCLWNTFSLLICGSNLAVRLDFSFT